MPVGMQPWDLWWPSMWNNACLHSLASVGKHNGPMLCFLCFPHWTSRSLFVVVHQALHGCTESTSLFCNQQDADRGPHAHGGTMALHSVEVHMALHRRKQLARIWLQKC